MEAIINKKRAKKREKIYSTIHHLLIDKGLLLYLIGLLLGRAVILYNISPFAIAFLATVWAIYQQRIYMIIAFILIGAWTYSLEHAVFITLSLGCFIILTKFSKDRLNMKYLILFVFFPTIMTRVFLYSLPSKVTVYELLHIMMEGTLGVILLLIFMQSIPLISLKRYQPTLKNEELICIVILIASVLTGLIGWDIYSVSLEHILSRYIVLVFAFVGGAAIGSTVGVEIGRAH